MDIKNRILLTFIFSLILTGIFWTLNQDAPIEPISIQEGFEQGLGNWVRDNDLPMDPNNPGRRVNWSITVIEEPVKSGAASAAFFIDGSQDDGTIWLEREIQVAPNERVSIDLEFSFFSGSVSFNTLAVVVASGGPINPEVEEDFTVIGPANRLEGWDQYQYNTITSTGEEGRIWIALGISVRWETHLIFFIDDISASIQYQ
jgi:hypothetical protein